MFFKDLFRYNKCPSCEAYHDPTLQECPNCHNANELFALNRFPKRVVFLHPLAQIGLFLAGFAYGGMFILEFILAFFVDYFPSNPILRSTLFMGVTYGIMLVSLLIIAIFSGRGKLFASKFNKGIDYIYGIGYAVTVVVGSIIVSSIVSWFYEMGNNANQDAIDAVAFNYPLLSFFTLCIIGPICEELTYRVGLYSLLRRFNKYFAIIVTSIVFALIHFEFFADDIIVELQSLPSYIVSGVILTIAYEHRGPACSMMAHMLYNTLAFAVVFIK